MGLFGKKTRLDIRIRRGILRALIPGHKAPPVELPTTTTTFIFNEKTNIDTSARASTDDESDTVPSPAATTKESEVSVTCINAALPTLNPSDIKPSSAILLLPAELLRDIFSYLDSTDIQALHNSHSYFRAIVTEHRSFLCKELASRSLRYYVRYLKPTFFDLQRESRARFLPNFDHAANNLLRCSTGAGQDGVPAWYLTLCRLDRVTTELYSLMPADENEWEINYLEAQGLPPSHYNPRVWPRPGNPSFYFTHTIISFYQYNTLIRLPKDSLLEFRTRDIKPVCRCAQGYFRSTAHLGILCAVYKACLEWKDSLGDGANEGIFKSFAPGSMGGLGNRIEGTRVSVKELFKMLVVVMHPANLLKVIKEPTNETMGKLRIVLETLKEVLVRNEAERRSSGVDRTYTKGLEMMEGFAQYWEDLDSALDRYKLRFFDDWELL
ncbi:hypothetical protein TWF694_007185 [Orbilia ellipsospora]|uniref:F-box domain-containing protein n=1 Tax=Orbilia ellipsospora TaxID=2528407 RepID=A0AAV9XKD8_9PEZI